MRTRGLLAIGVLLWVALLYMAYSAWQREPSLDWISSKDNTYPSGRSFEIREEGKYPWFGSAKVGYDLPVKTDQYICARVDADNKNYSWEVMIYWRAVAADSSTMVHMGAYPWAFSSNGWRCHKVRPMYRADTGIMNEMVIYRAHWVGYGSGGVRASPILVVSDVDLSE